MSERNGFIIMWIIIIAIEAIGIVWLLYIKNPIAGFIFAWILPQLVILTSAILTKDEYF